MNAMLAKVGAGSAHLAGPPVASAARTLIGYPAMLLNRLFTRARVSTTVEA
jgi:hypothetical protein